MSTDFPFKVFLQMKTTDSDHIDDWCDEQFGVQGEYWDCYFADDNPWKYDLYYIFLKHEDAVLFTLRWV